MKKMLTLLLTLFALYFGIQFVFNYFSKGHDISYKVSSNDGDINVREILSLNGVENNNYYFEITHNNVTVPFKVMKDYMHKQKIIRDVKIYTDDKYYCASIKLEGDELPSDIKCLNKEDNIIYFYGNNVYGKDVELDKKIKEDGYLIGNYMENTKDYKEKDGIIVYNKNFVPKHNFLINAYKGEYLFGEKVTNSARLVSLFNKDIYNQSLQGNIGKYFLVADYNEENFFNIIHVINIDNGSKYDIKSDFDISFNSFVEGSVDNSLYIVDVDSKKQYEINVSKKKVSLFGSESNGASIYQDGVWVDANINDVISQKIIFTTINNTYNDNQYSKVLYVGNKIYGTYYLFKQNNDKYDVYAIYSGSNQSNYLFTTTDLNRIVYNKGYIYYIFDENLRVFSSDFGNKTLLTYKELKFNNNIKIFVH